MKKVGVLMVCLLLLVPVTLSEAVTKAELEAHLKSLREELKQAERGIQQIIGAILNTQDLIKKEKAKEKKVVEEKNVEVEKNRRK